MNTIEKCGVAASFIAGCLMGLALFHVSSAKRANYFAAQEPICEYSFRYVVIREQVVPKFDPITSLPERCEK